MAHPVKRRLELHHPKLHGGDITELEQAANRRLHEFGAAKTFQCVENGQYGDDDVHAAHKAIDLLGLSATTVRHASRKHGGVLTQNTQHLIRNPGDRTQKQLARSRQRNLKRSKNSKIDRHGLTDKQVHHARLVAVHAARVGLAHAAGMNYTQGPDRWSGIAGNHLSTKGGFPPWADCSAFYTWCWWNALAVEYGMDDVLNGAGWAYGYTGSLRLHGQVVSKPVLGDGCHYGPGTGAHVTIYVGGGMCISFGSSPGPFLLPVHYRSDFSHYRRHV